MGKRKRRNANNRPPSTLYHYTTADGLLSMFRTGHLWATDAGYMNDPHELRYGLDCLAMVAERHARFRRVAAQLRSLIEDVARQKILNGRIYLASFSRDGDLLSQWRAYGANGGGFAIGLSSRVLLATAPEFSGQATRVLQRVVYDKRLQVAQLEQALRKISTRHIAGERARLPLLLWFSDFLMSFKHPSFSEEAEWRLIQFGRLLDRDGNEAASLWPASFRVRGGRIVSYADLDLTGDRGVLAGKLPAVEIVCGPTVHRELGIKVLRELCESMGYRAVIKGSRESRTTADKRPRLLISASATPFVS